MPEQNDPAKEPSERSEGWRNDPIVEPSLTRPKARRSRSPGSPQNLKSLPMMRLQRIAAAAACALLLACPASAQLIGSGHVMGNGKNSPAAATDTQLLQVMNQSGSGIASGVGAVLGVSPNTNGGMATLGSTPVNGQCPQFNSAGSFISIVCPTGGGGGSGTVNAGTKGQFAAYNASTNAVVGIPGCVPFETFGGSIANSTTPAGRTANSAAENSLIAAFPSGGGCIAYGPGTYSFDAGFTIVYPTLTAPACATACSYSVTLKGLGQDLTALDWPGAANAFTFTETATSLPSFHIRDMTLTTGANGGGNAIVVNNLQTQIANAPQSDITNVTIRAENFQAFNAYWVIGVELSGVSNVNMTGLNIIGKPTGSPISGGSDLGIKLAGWAAGSQYGVILNISHSNLEYLATGISYGSYIQGVTVDNTTINFNNNGILVPTGSTGTLAALLVTNSFFNNYTFNILTQVPVDDLQVSNSNFILLPSTVGIECDPCAGGSFIGNTIAGTSPSGNIGYLIEANATYPLIMTGNSFQGLQWAILTNATTATLCNIQSNGYSSAPVSNSGTCALGGGSQ
jgi:hypothetical protein